MIDDLTPRRRGRPRKEVIRVPEGMPIVESATGSDRELLALWWKEKARDLQQFYEDRIEILRTVGEHPSPVFAKIVRIDGGLGMPKELVAKKLGMPVSMFMLHYGEEYDLGSMHVISSVMANGIRIATSTTDPAAAKMVSYILDRRGGKEWKPPARRIETKNDDAPPVIDSSKLTPEERNQLRIMLTRISEDGESAPSLDEEDPIIP